MEDTFVEMDRYAIASSDLFWFSGWSGEDGGHSMGLILEARSHSFLFLRVCFLGFVYFEFPGSFL